MKKTTALNSLKKDMIKKWKSTKKIFMKIKIFKKISNFDPNHTKKKALPIVNIIYKKITLLSAIIVEKFILLLKFSKEYINIFLKKLDKYQSFLKMKKFIYNSSIKFISFLKRYILPQIKYFLNWMKKSLKGEKIDYQKMPREPDIRNIKIIGLSIIIVFFGGFGLWVVFASLDSAAVATGQVIVNTERKTVQHLEGGIIKNIFIEEGDLVEKGDLLIQLDEVQAQEKINAFEEQLNMLLISEARLLTERDGAEIITFPEEILKQINDQKVQKKISTQQLSFDTNKKEFKGAIEILNKKISQMQEELESYKAQVASGITQKELISKEIITMTELDRKGLILKSRLYSLQREEARLLGNLGDHQGKIAQTQHHIQETETEIANRMQQQKQETLKQLYEVQKDIPRIREQLSASRDVMKRLSIIAPQKGFIMDLKVHTIGGVIRTGEPLMELVPSTDKLIIKARVHPTDIDMIRIGLVSQVNLLPFKARYTGRLEGKVTEISADSFHDQKTGESYYEVLVVIDPKELEKIKGLYLYPGMPAQVIIITHKRTPLQYLFSPIRDSFDRAFREK